MSVAYDSFYKYIDLLSDDLGEWFSDKDSDKAAEPLVQFSFVVYSQNVHALIEDVLQFAELNDVKNYGEVLEQNGIEWNPESMSKADINELQKDAVFALLLAAVRAERFCDGVLLELLENGSIQRWLKVLQNEEK